MKLFRWLYYTFMVIILIAGMYSGFRVFYIIFFTQFLMVAAVLAISLWTVYTFRFKQELSVKTCVKGKEAVLHLEIGNEKPIPLSLIEVHVDVVSFRENVNLVFSLAPYSGKTFRIPVATPYRGRYKVGMTKLNITDIFGLTSFPFDMRRLSYYRMCELVVLPKAGVPGTVSADIEDTKFFGDPYLKQAETGDTVSGARLYHEGDSLKRVHWKKSAQQGELFVKQFEYPERERVMMLVDTATHGLAGESLLVYADTICECASSIALHSLTQNRLVYVMNSADFGLPLECAALSGFESIRRHLALLPFDEKSDLYGALSKSNRGYEQAYALFVLTRGAEPAYMQALERILAAYKSVTMVIVGGPKPGGHVHSLYVEPGSDAADSLCGLFR
jgi:uncharacterized protein (DUF58 family)